MRHVMPLPVFVILTSIGILVGIYFNVTWEFDAATRAEQALFLAQRGAYWYFFVGFGQGYYVWLPLWQFLLAGIYILAGINPTLGGILVSAASAGFIGLIVLSILKRGGLNRPRQFLGAILPLTSGYFVAYSSQGMTDIFSTMLLFGSIYYFLLYVESRAARYLALASVLTLLNAMTRYESWLFLVVTLSYALFLTARKTLDWRTMLKVVLYAVPSFLFMMVWLYYNFLASGNFLGFAAWISRNVLTSPPAFYRDFTLTIANFAFVLLLSNGLLWLTLVDVRGAGTTTSFATLGAILFTVYSAYFTYSTFIGFNAGWVRFFLYFVPFSVVSFISKNYRKEFAYFIVGVSIVLGMLGFAQNALLHQLANGGS